MRRNSFVLMVLFFTILSGGVLLHSCKHSPYVLPEDQRTNDPSICFERDILPVLQSNCAKSGCHDAASGEKGYVLDNYANIMKKGIVPGNPAASTIWQSLNYTTGEKAMPKDAPRLSDATIDLIKRWIAAGAVDSGACTTSACDTSKFTYSSIVAPIMQSNCTGCHNAASDPGGSFADYNSVKEAAVNGRLIGDIEHLPGYNNMPKNGAKLQDCQITQVKKWVAAGALNN